VTIFDYLVLLVMGCSVIIGTLRGFVREVLSLASWVVALVVANAYGEALAGMLPEMIPGESTRLIVAFIALFIGTRLLMALVSRTLSELIKASGLTLVDRGLGSVFGVARAILIVVAVALLCGTTSIPQQPFWKDAVLSPLVEQAALNVMPFLPGKFAEHVSFSAPSEV
jgi:membrane protein required for colicin V production